MIPVEIMGYASRLGAQPVEGVEIFLQLDQAVQRGQLAPRMRSFLPGALRQIGQRRQLAKVHLTTGL